MVKFYKMFAILVFTLIIETCNQKSDPYPCVNRRKIYKNEFHGIFILIETVEEKVRPETYARFKNKYRTINLSHPSFPLQDNIKTGDSVYKAANSVYFMVYRKGILVHEFDENNWDCDFSIIDSLKNEK